MDLSTPQEPIVIKTEKQNFNILSILLPLFTLLVGIGLGLLVSRIIFPTPLKPTQKSAITPQITKADLPLPVSSNLLKNPIIYEWRGTITGKLIAKDEHTLTLTDDKGNEITITDLLPNGTGTFKTMYLKYLKKTGSRPAELALKDIPLGTTLRGDIIIFKNFPNTPVANVFTIME